MQPLRLAVLFVAVCCLIQVGAWYHAAVELAQTATARSGHMPMFAVMATAFGSGLVLARTRARRVTAAYVAAGGVLPPRA